MITEAHISGPIRRAVFKQNGEYFITELKNGEYNSVPINLFDLNNFTFSDSEIVRFNNINWEIEFLFQELNHYSKKHEALNLILMGMDSSLSQDLRKEAIELALPFLLNKDVEIFIKNRLFSTQIPKLFNPLSASEIAEGIGNNVVVKWYEDLCHANDIIITIRDA